MVARAALSARSLDPWGLSGESPWRRRGGAHAVLRVATVGGTVWEGHGHRGLRGSSLCSSLNFSSGNA